MAIAALNRADGDEWIRSGRRGIIERSRVRVKRRKPAAVAVVLLSSRRAQAASHADRLLRRDSAIRVGPNAVGE